VDSVITDIFTISIGGHHLLGNRRFDSGVAAEHSERAISEINICDPIAVNLCGTKWKLLDAFAPKQAGAGVHLVVNVDDQDTEAFSVSMASQLANEHGLASAAFHHGY
jgi:hypothetical protein